MTLHTLIIYKVLTENPNNCGSKIPKDQTIDKKPPFKLPTNNIIKDQEYTKLYPPATLK